METDERFAIGRKVVVSLPPREDLGMEVTLDIIKDVLGRLGCDGCASGFDIRLKHQIGFVYDAQKAELASNVGR